MNNFDTSSKGVNLELSCFFDNDLSRFWFDETFHILQHASMRQNSILVYGVNLKPELSDFKFTDLDNYDLNGTTIEQIFKAYGREIFDNKDPSLWTYSQVKEIYQDLDIVRLKNETIESLLNSIETAFYCDHTFYNFLISVLKPKFLVATSRGHCQGDYSEIVIHESLLDEFGKDELYQLESHLQDEIDHLLWDSPLYCRLTIDDDEIDLTEPLRDLYNYDQDEILKQADKMIEHKKKAYILEWLGENLPVQPDYY